MFCQNICRHIISHDYENYLEVPGDLSVEIFWTYIDWIGLISLVVGIGSIGLHCAVCTAEMGIPKMCHNVAITDCLMHCRFHYNPIQNETAFHPYEIFRSIAF
ncbi:hypothetical protein CEXT_773981 [Caerostris extrusa]|uniref:Uncharacterized protein n=1 Tax=Caerostris extrusa TaxID=172846 RepID=A0AAV4RL87_CAEEX|nr:hypothetical protein CEXT_773981 [Caerostris extrusa]